MNIQLIDILISTLAILIMFGIGLTLTIKDFKAIFIKPKAVVVALSFQMIVLPIIAFFICIFAPIKPEFKVGLIILACSPGGSTSGFITYLLKANIALSVSLTAINSLLTLISIPILVSIGLKTFMVQSVNLTLPILPTILQIFFVIIIPTMAGVIVRHYKESFALKAEKVAKVIIIILMLVTFVIKFFASENNGGAVIVKGDYISILPYAILFNLTCILLGYMFILAFRLDHKTGITTSVETSVHNTPLALLVAGTIIGNQEMVKPILIYSLFSFWTPLIFGYFANKLTRQPNSNSEITKRSTNR